MLEAVVLFAHVPIGLDRMITIGGETMHVNYLNVLTLIRTYTFARVMRNHSGFYGQQIHCIGREQGVETMSIAFCLKMMLKETPFKLLVPLFVFNCLVTAIAITMFERIQVPP